MRRIVTMTAIASPDLDQLAADYQRDGFVKVSGLLTSTEAAAYRKTSHELLARLEKADDPTWGSASEVSMGLATSLQHLHDAQFYDAAYSRLLTDPRFTSVAAAVLGTPNVQLHHTKLFVKPPENGSPFPLHQDHPFFPHTYNRVAAAIFHFDDAPEEKGCVRVVPGSHLAGPGRGAAARQGRRRVVLQLPDGARLRRERQQRGTDHLAGAVPRSGRSAADRRAQPFTRPGHDAGRHRPDRPPALTW
jgi:ectoine hydroxylase-related dioxygenase (phytanoyl-CoA dioxygenase family)